MVAGASMAGAGQLKNDAGLLANVTVGEGSIIQWTEFNHFKDNYPKDKAGTFDDVADRCSKPFIRESKDGKAFCPATYSGTRAIKNAISTAYLAFDLDRLPEDTSAGDILASVPGMLSFSYTSHSHLMPGKGGRFRLVVATDKPIPAIQVKRVREAFAKKYLSQWAEGVDTACFEPSRIFYYPSCPADRVGLFQFERQEGQSFDWEALSDTNTTAATSNETVRLPDDLVAMFGGKANLIPAGGKPIVKDRNNELHRRGSAMRGQGLELAEIAGELLRLNQEVCKPPLPSEEVLTLASNICGRYEAGKKSEVLPGRISRAVVSEAANVTELALAKAIADAYGGQFHYVAESGKFYVLEDSTSIWVEDFSGQVSRWFFDLLEQGKELAFALIRERDDSGNKLLSSVLKAERNNFIGGAITLIRALHGVTVRQAIFDANPYLVGFMDGMCADLKTGEVRQIQPDDYLTKTLGTYFDPDAVCPKWRTKVDEWSRGDAELVRFLQVLIGYALSGLTEVQAIFFLFGSGANGKSVFVSIISSLFGAYAVGIGSESLMMKTNGSEATNDLARCDGARVVTSSEVPEGGWWNENRLKSMSGGDKMTARYMYREFFEFTFTAILLISGNHKPIVRGNDHGIWRRMNLIPFLATVENPDPDLTNKLKTELPGILNWALEGWRIYQSEGLKIPECIKRESAGYRAEMDIVGQWLELRTTPLPGNKIRASEFYSDFKDWAITNGFHVPNSSSFGRKLEGRVATSRDGKGRYYCDLKWCGM